MSSKAVVNVIIDMPVDAAWEKLQDLSLAHNYVPGIVKTEIVSKEKTGLGASRKVYQSNSKALQETVTEWNEGQGFRIRLHKGLRDSPFKNSYFEYKLTDAGQNKTRLTTIMEYTPPMGRIGRTLDAAVLNRIIKKVIRDVAFSMKYFYETGKPTTKKDLQNIKRAA